MPIAPPVLNSHGTVISVMRELGYLTDKKGVCSGLAFMWGQAVLSGEEDKFIRRIALITHPDFLNQMQEYKSRIATLEKKLTEEKVDIRKPVTDIRKQIHALEKEKEDFYKQKKNITAIDAKLDIRNKQLEAAIQERNEKEKLIEKNNFNVQDFALRDAIAFFDALEIAQQSHRHTILFEGETPFQSNIEILSRLIGSNQVNSKDGIMKLNSEDKKYSHEELANYMESWRRAILRTLKDDKEEKIKKDANDIIIDIGANGHGTALRYDIEKKAWIHMDANKMPPEEVKPQHLADRIEAAHFNNEKPDMTMHTIIYTTTNNYSALYTHNIFKQITEEWKNLRDAVKQNDSDTLEKLANAGADLNRIDLGTGRSLMEMAILEDKADIVNKFKEINATYKIDFMQKPLIEKLRFLSMSPIMEKTMGLKQLNNNPQLKEKLTRPVLSEKLESWRRAIIEEKNDSMILRLRSEEVNAFLQYNTAEKVWTMVNSQTRIKMITPPEEMDSFLAEIFKDFNDEKAEVDLQFGAYLTDNNAVSDIQQKVDAIHQDWIEARAAAKSDDTKKLDNLIKKGIDLSRVDKEKGHSLIDMAINEGKLDVIKSLISHAEKINLKQQPILHMLAKNKRSDLIPKLQKNYDLKAMAHIKNDEQKTALEIAIEQKDMKMVTELIKMDANISEKNDRNISYLQLAFMHNFPELITKIIQDQKTLAKSENEIDKKRATEYKRALTQTDANGQNLLHHATLAKSNLVIEELAKPEYQEYKNTYLAPDNNGETPFVVAVKYPLNTKLIEKFITSGYDVKQIDKEGRTLIHIVALNAKSNGHKDYITHLVTAGADINQADNKGVTPLEISLRKNDFNLAKALISKGAQLDRVLTPAIFSTFSEKMQDDLVRNIIETKNTAASEKWLSQSTKPPFSEGLKRNSFDFIVGFLQAGLINLKQISITKGDKQDELFLGQLFHHAVVKGEVTLVENLLKEYKINLEYNPNNNGRTPLADAVWNLDFPMIKLLITAGADYRNISHSNSGDTFTTWLLKNKKYDIVKVLKDRETERKDIKTTNLVDEKNWQGVTTLCTAITDKDDSMLKHALELGADVNLPTFKNYTPLQLAILNNMSALNTLLEHRQIDIHQCGGPNKTTPLWCAIEQKNLDAVHALLKKDVNINQEIQGELPLTYALRTGALDIAMALITKGVLTQNYIEKNWDATMKILMKGNLEKKLELEELKKVYQTVAFVAVKKEDYTNVVYLDRSGIKIEKYNEKKQNVIHLAVHQDKDVFIQKLYPYRKSDFDARDAEGKTPFHLSVELNKKAAFNELLNERYRVGFNSRDNHGRTPLFTAVEKCHKDMIQPLIKYGAIVLQDNKNNTPYHIAAQQKDPTILEELKKNDVLFKYNIYKTNNENKTAFDISLDEKNAPTTLFFLHSGVLNDNAKKRTFSLFNQLDDKKYLHELMKYEYKNNFNVADTNNGTLPLIYAVAMNANDIVSDLIAKGVMSDNFIEKNWRCTIEIINKFDIKTLLKPKEKIEKLHQTILSTAIKKLDDKAISALKKSCLDSENNTLYHMAVKQNDYSLITKLIAMEKNKDDLNQPNNDTITPLDIAVFEKKFPIVLELLRAGIFVNPLAAKELLFLAAQENQPELIQELLKPKYEIKFSSNDAFGEKLVRQAMEAKQFASLILLIKAGVDPRRITIPPENLTITGFAAKYNQLELLTLLKEKYGNEILTTVDSQDRTPLHVAVQHQHFWIIEYLTANIKKLDDYDATDHTPLHIAAKGSDPVILASLIKKGAEINKTLSSDNKTTALDLSLEFKKSDNTQALVKNGADLSFMKKDFEKTVKVLLSLQEEHILSPKVITHLHHIRPQLVAALVEYGKKLEPLEKRKLLDSLEKKQNELGRIFHHPYPKSFDKDLFKDGDIDMKNIRSAFNKEPGLGPALEMKKDHLDFKKSRN